MVNSYDGRPCTWCKDIAAKDGQYPIPDFTGIIAALKPTRGKNKAGIRASAPSYKIADLDSCRIYFVWRWFRFHAGLDVTLPMNADLVLHADPYSKELEQLSHELARSITGRVSQGALRWGRVLGGVSDDVMSKLEKAGQVGDSARECGPVFDENKPDFEGPETK